MAEPLPFAGKGAPCGCSGLTGMHEVTCDLWPEFIPASAAPTCACDLQHEAPEWWANTPGLHHLAPCPLRDIAPEGGSA